MARITAGRMAALAVLGSVALAGCEQGGPGIFQRSGDTATDTPGTVTLVDRDVEAPEVFQVTTEGLWDGRPSLGGVWVAHPDVTEPERVIIRNEANGKFVIGALFDRARENPGPAFQVSSDAAEALGMLAGAPVTLNVTALRRQEVPIASETPAGTGEGTGEAGEVETTTLDGDASASGAPAETDTTAATAAAAIAAAEARQGEAGTAPTPAPTPTPAPAAERASTLAKPYIQIGLFSVEANANRAGDQLRAQGVIPVIRKATSQGKTFWRVIVGPASNSAERAALLKKVKEIGYADAYFVRN